MTIEDDSQSRPGSRPNYLKAAFLNVYNLSLLGGAAIASVLTADPLIFVGAAAGEALWLVFGPEIKRFQRAVRASDQAERDRQDRERIDAMMKGLAERDWQRAKALDELRHEIQRDMQNNPSFQAILLQTELDKMTQLQVSFVKLASGCQRAETYLAEVDTRELERQSQAQKRLAENATDASVKELAEKNASVIEKRLETIKDIQAFLARARGQMTLIENTVRLLRDQALTMTSPDQLTEQLNDLLLGVDAVAQSSKDAEAMITGRFIESVDPLATAGGDASSSSRSRVR